MQDAVVFDHIGDSVHTPACHGSKGRKRWNAVSCASKQMESPPINGEMKPGISKTRDGINVLNRAVASSSALFPSERICSETVVPFLSSSSIFRDDGPPEVAGVGVSNNFIVPGGSLTAAVACDEGSLPSPCAMSESMSISILTLEICDSLISSTDCDGASTDTRV